MMPTETLITVAVTATSRCPLCHDTVEREFRLTEEEARSSPHTNLLDVCKSLREDIEKNKGHLLWNEQSCGKCRILSYEKELKRTGKP